MNLHYESRRAADQQATLSTVQTSIAAALATAVPALLERLVQLTPAPAAANVDEAALEAAMATVLPILLEREVAYIHIYVCRCIDRCIDIFTYIHICIYIKIDRCSDTDI